jgi:hypothetical protein
VWPQSRIYVSLERKPGELVDPVDPVEMVSILSQQKQTSWQHQALVRGTLVTPGPLDIYT